MSSSAQALPGQSAPGRFTLIELLVVVAIIAVLASLLLPALGKARGKSRESVCTSNEKQIGITFMLYADEYDGFLPWCYDRSGTTWGNKLATSISMGLPTGAFVGASKGGIFNCPNNGAQIRICGSGSGESQVSYTANGWSTQAQVEDSGNANNQPLANKLASFNHPTELQLLWDGTYFRAEFGHNNGVGDGQGSIPINFGRGPRNIRYVHNSNGVNLLYADGHSEFKAGPLLDRGSYQGVFGGINKYVNGRAYYAYYPF